MVLASAARPQLVDGATRCPITNVTSVSTSRPSIIGRDNFFVRYGEKEREAVASFDFLKDYCSTTASNCSSIEEEYPLFQNDSVQQTIQASKIG